MKRSQMFKLFFIGAMASLLIAPAHAQAKTSAEYQKCSDNVDLGAFKNSQWASCSEDELKRQDVVLNAEYKSLRETLSVSQRETLLKAQRSWLKFREDWCRFEEVGRIGPGGSARYYSCLVELTGKQIDALKSSK